MSDNNNYNNITSIHNLQCGPLGQPTRAIS